MKCDELKPIELECNMGKDSVTGLVNREPWKAYDIDEVDAAILEVNQVLDEKDAEIEDLLRQNRELCQALQVMYSKEEYGKLQKEIESLKAKLETVQATAYADSVDAGMRERRLKRALWLARAEHAADKARIFYFAATCGVLLNIDGYSNRKKGRQRLDTAMKWEHVWLKVERKCLKKAEEYK